MATDQAAINDVFTFTLHGSIMHVDDHEAKIRIGESGDVGGKDFISAAANYKPKIDVGTYMEGASPTQVSIEGKMIVNEQVRKSTSIRDKFVISKFDEWKKLFDVYKIGVGSKHVYNVGDFMCSHYDSRRPDLDGLPHIMTLVVFYNYGEYEGGQLIVNDKPIVFQNKRENERDKYMVLFGLGCKHEVLDVTKGKRITFTFPVYGKYNYINKTIESLKIDKPINIYDFILNLIEDAQKNGLAEKSADFHGFIRALKDTTANDYAIRLRKIYEGWVPLEFSNSDHDENDDREVVIEYDLDDAHYCDVLDKHYHVPDGAYNVIIHRNNQSFAILQKLRTHVLELKKEAEELDASRKEEKVEYYLEDLEFLSEFLTGTNPIYILLGNRYLVGSTVDNLTANDRELYDYLCTNKERTVTFLPLAKKPDSYYNTFNVYKFANGKLDKLERIKYGNQTEDVATTELASIDIEFDDQGSYDPQYVNAYGLFLIK